MTDLERARKLFSATVYATEVTGCVIEEVRPDYARCSLSVEPKHMNGLGIPMGGAVFTLADFAFGVCANFDKGVFVTLSADSHFLAPCKGHTMVAEARELRAGRRVCLYSVTVTDELGSNIAYFTFTGLRTEAHKAKRPSAAE